MYWKFEDDGFPTVMFQSPFVVSAVCMGARKTNRKVNLQGRLASYSIINKSTICIL